MLVKIMSKVALFFITRPGRKKYHAIIHAFLAII